MRFYIQHGAGLGELVYHAAQDDLGGIDVVFDDDSGMVFDARSAPDRVAALPYVKNAFEVLDTVPRQQLPASIDQLVRLIHRQGIPAGRQRNAPFRIMVNLDGQLVGLPGQSRARLESVIAEQTGGRLNPRGGAGVEYWVVGRRDLDVLIFARRLSAGGKTSVPRGALAPDLATLLVKASQPESDDVFLDPFAGSGAVVAARLEMPLHRAIYSDLRLDAFRDDLSPRLVTNRRVTLLDEDAMRLPSVPDGSVSAIVTDPPWGEFEELDQPYEEFTRQMLTSFDRVLHPQDGRIVMLVGRRASAGVTELWLQSPLKGWNSYDILVNGHPASVLVGGR